MIAFSMALAALLIISVSAPALTTSISEKFDFSQRRQPSGNHDFILHTDGHFYYTVILQFDSLSEDRLQDRPGILIALSSIYAK
jgi:hypothetical protein